LIDKMDFNVGDIFWLDVEFEDDPDSSKRRLGNNRWW